MVSPESVSAAKAELRRRYRTLRRSIEDPVARSERICSALTEHRAIVAAGTVMVFDAIVGEPDLGNLRHWCEQHGIAVVVPEQDPDPGSVDVIIVPGVAFTPHGDRLGQGGGWYDRFLERVSDDVVTIGVAFAEQIVDAIPLEAHDRRLDAVLCDDGWVLTVS